MAPCSIAVAACRPAGDEVITPACWAAQRGKNGGVVYQKRWGRSQKRAAVLASLNLGSQGFLLG